MWSVTIRKLDCYMEERFSACAWQTTSSAVSQGDGEESIPDEEPPVNPYQMLQVRKDATHSEMRLAYRRLSLWHHPGRFHESEAELARRSRIFELLAACCETLLERESRERCDILLKEWEIQQQELVRNFPPGDVRVGGKSINCRSFTETQNVSACSPLPDLSRVSSESSSDDEDNDVTHSTLFECGKPKVKTTRGRLPLVSKAPSSEDELDIHYTQKDTMRLFGGALSILYKSRNFKPFTDPFDFFTYIFGSEIFPRPKQLLTTVAPHGTARDFVLSSPSAAWTGSSETVKNGTTVYTTSRILHNRILTKTETITVDPKTGRKKSHISVTSEDIVETPEEDLESYNVDLCCAPDTFLIPGDDIGDSTEAFWDTLLNPCKTWSLV